MKKNVLNFISLAVVFCMMLSFASCKRQSEGGAVSEEPLPTTKITTQPVKIVEAPTSEEEIFKLFNTAIDYIDLYCYHYTKNVNCEVSGVNVGNLTASNAAEAFRSIFGQKNITMNYDYNVSRDSFAANAPKPGYTIDEVQSITAEQVGDDIIITAVFPNESNPTDDKGVLYRLSPDYQNVDDVKQALTEFSSSATAVSVSASDIVVKATVNAEDSSLKELEISYIERYSLSGVVLVKLEGSAVSGTAKTVVKYTEIGV